MTNDEIRICLGVGIVVAFLAYQFGAFIQYQRQGGQDVRFDRVCASLRSVIQYFRDTGREDEADTIADAGGCLFRKRKEPSNAANTL